MMMKSNEIEIVYKSWGPFRIYQLNSTATQAALFERYWADLALLIIWYIDPKRPQGFEKLFQLHYFSPQFLCQNNSPLSTPIFQAYYYVYS